MTSIAQNVFGNKQKRLKEDWRKGKREINKAIRELKRDSQKALTERAQLQARIKKEAGSGVNTGQVRSTAKRIIRIDKQVLKLEKMMGQMQDMIMQTEEMMIMNRMSEQMKRTTKIITKLNGQMNLKKLQTNSRKYMEELLKAEIFRDLVNDTLEDTFDDNEELEDELFMEVLTKAGLEATADLISAPQSNPISTLSKQEADAEEPIAVGDDSEVFINSLEERLNNL
mmetsp:Transcript_4749/g.5984  ORF Transcript_4749/g.5984 Transcript_4749/m.5984 type:complete len:227 (+) Transcript_4749:165-845(+)|eukprot:CAMPEP_0204843850 /NCGR_PEP_ID=MMETSP1346-20131115/48223_1 /ASSEMBLY_ACC=CAM_ASM_000771 /TAXON_ID=215587 /ORGANISM="Aplanochytrium stocchinoi, Strain GSBS06" /LENGTH=226 /DNA_ID=CAMNT_0051983071 /DNA_START=207 /DNA_END=887 /DNA_ORIENTATION=+